jgi:hypothetical protein
MPDKKMSHVFFISDGWENRLLRLCLRGWGFVAKDVFAVNRAHFLPGFWDVDGRPFWRQTQKTASAQIPSLSFLRMLKDRSNTPIPRCRLNVRACFLSKAH